MTTLIKYFLILVLSFGLIAGIGSNAQFGIDFRDSDGDGMSNYFEDNISLSNKDLFDTDGDGYGDFYEYYNKDSGGDPNDATKFPMAPTPDQDKDGDGLIDPFFDSLQFSVTNFVTVVNDSNLGPAVCNLPTIDKAQYQFNPLTCTYKLIGVANNQYFLGFMRYYISLDALPTAISSDCFINNNNTVDAELVCAEVPYKDVELGVHKLVLSRANIGSSTYEIVNNTSEVDIVDYGTRFLTDTLSLDLDSIIPRSCEAVESGGFTTCNFQLPALTTLPDNYKLGVGTTPGGDCVSDQDGLVTCTEVPTARSASKNVLRSNILDETGKNTAQIANMLTTESIAVPTVEIEYNVNGYFPVITGLPVSYNGPVNLFFDGDGAIMVGRVENGVFTPIDVTNYSKLPANQTIGGTIQYVNTINSYQSMIARLIIKTIDKQIVTPPNTPPTVQGKIVNNGELSRTGGINNITALTGLIALMFFLISNYLIFRPKLTKKTIKINL
jgi:hypothetical protein